LADRWSSARVEVAAEAQALHRVEEPLLRALAGWAEGRGVHFAMHLSYSEAAAAHALERFGRPLLLLLEEWGVLGPRFLGYHPVWVSDEEIAAAARTQAGLAYCPVDNMLIACGVAPVQRLLDAGCRLGLGVDQPNDGHSFFELMKLAILLQRVTHLDASLGSPEQALELATIGGARALHREHEVGSLEPGKAADLLVLDGRRSAFAPFPGRLSNVVYAATPAEVEHVFVGGEAVVRDGRHARWDEEEVVRDANRAMRATLRRAELPEDLGPHTEWPVL
ncbi:MAG: amidohydrolase family protein, partial [Chloroflexi bacterium]|nr:amidohydrolase family protein [Chloroflexota bacterium]